MAARPKTDGTPPHRPTRAERRRAALDAAAGLVRKHGYAGATPELVAEAVGRKADAVRKTFPTRGDVLAALAGEFTAAVFDAPADPPDPAAELAGLPSRFRKAAKSHGPAAAAVLQLLAGPRTEADFAPVAAVLAAFEAAVAERIRAGQAAGVVRRSLDAAACGRDWLRYLLGAELLRITDETADEAPADLLIHGLLKTDV